MPRWIAVSCLLAAAVAGVVGWNTPSLKIDVAGASAVAHLGRLGGDSADLGYIELSVADRDEQVWRVIARHGSFQVRTVKFAVGANPSTLAIEGGRAYTVEPESAPIFTLSPRTEYLLHVCPGSITGLCRSERFTLGN